MAKAQIGRMIAILAAGAAAFAVATPALADVKDGVDAWSRGDFAAAVAEWQGPAQAGDPDAMFNLGQAYRLGRGVPKDAAKAEDLYARAAAKGHLQAADIYGLMLFQSGRREQALPYVQDAARRGDPRSEYLLGVAYFNGDGVPKDWTKAYALLTLANGQGLPQAKTAIGQMDDFIPLDQRQKGASLAVQMQAEADAARAREMAAADLAMGDTEIPASTAKAPPAPPPPVQVAAAPRSAVPEPIPSVPVEPSVAEAREAVRQAQLATGTESPAEAGADYARPAVAPPAPARVAANIPSPAPQPPARTEVRPQAPASSGPWKVQLGAFSVSGNAERLWNQLAGRPELAGKKRLLVPSGGLTKLLAGGYATQAEAAAACSRLKQSGQGCLVTK